MLWFRLHIKCPGNNCIDNDAAFISRLGMSKRAAAPAKSATTTPPSNLQDHLGYWLRTLSNAVSHAFSERLQAHDVSVAQWVVLRVVYDRPSISLRELAAEVGVDQGALSRMIERLVTRRLIDRVPKPGNRREIEITLTAEGRGLVPKLAREADTNDHAFFQVLSETQQRQFLKTIKALLQANPDSIKGSPLN